jgi:hypothetical protein
VPARGANNEASTSQLHFSDFPGRIIIVGFEAIGQASCR